MEITSFFLCLFFGGGAHSVSFLGQKLTSWARDTLCFKNFSDAVGIQGSTGKNNVTISLWYGLKSGSPRHPSNFPPKINTMPQDASSIRLIQHLWRCPISCLMPTRSHFLWHCHPCSCQQHTSSNIWKSYSMIRYLLRLFYLMSHGHPINTTPYCTTD